MKNDFKIAVYALDSKKLLDIDNAEKISEKYFDNLGLIMQFSNMKNKKNTIYNQKMNKMFVRME